MHEVQCLETLPSYGSHFHHPKACLDSTMIAVPLDHVVEAAAEAFKHQTVVEAVFESFVQSHYLRGSAGVGLLKPLEDLRLDFGGVDVAADGTYDFYGFGGVIAYVTYSQHSAKSAVPEELDNFVVTSKELPFNPLEVTLVISRAEACRAV